MPTLKQVQNVCKYTRGPILPFTFAQLEEYCAQNNQTPEDIDKAFVQSYKIDEPAKKFFILWTTKKLQQKQFDSPLLQVIFVYFFHSKRQNQPQADSTYSLTYNLRWFDDFPVQVFGFSDVDKHFHPTFLALSSNEDQWIYANIFTALGEYKPVFVLGDGSKAITAACSNVRFINCSLKKINFKVWPESIRLMCYPHMWRNVEKRTKGLTEDKQKTVHRDIHFLQMAMDEQEFVKGLNYFYF